MIHPAISELEAGLGYIKSAPREQGVLEKIVRRPAVNLREVVEMADLDLEKGLMGDSWIHRPSRSTPDSSPHPLMQLNVMSARAISLIAGDPDRWALAGDQMYIDLDLSIDNLPTGTRLAIGNAVIEVTEPPHRGCQKFSSRFGADALRFVNSEEGRSLRLRGFNARVVVAGTIRRGDSVMKIPA